MGALFIKTEVWREKETRLLQGAPFPLTVLGVTQRSGRLGPGCGHARCHCHVPSPPTHTLTPLAVTSLCVSEVTLRQVQVHTFFKW